MNVMIVIIASVGFMLLSERVIRIIRGKSKIRAISRMVADLAISIGFGIIGTILAGVTGGLAGLIAGVYTSWRIGYGDKKS